jgi:hypothetical protein
MLSEQLKPELHGVPIAGVGGPAGGGGTAGNDEHSLKRQLPPGQSVSVKQEFDDSEKESSVDALPDDSAGACTQPASNPRTRMIVRLMSRKPLSAKRLISSTLAHEAALRFAAREGAFASTSARARSYKSRS